MGLVLFVGLDQYSKLSVIILCRRPLCHDNIDWNLKVSFQMQFLKKQVNIENIFKFVVQV